MNYLITIISKTNHIIILPQRIFFYDLILISTANDQRGHLYFYRKKVILNSIKFVFIYLELLGSSFILFHTLNQSILLQIQVFQKYQDYKRLGFMRAFWHSTFAQKWLRFILCSRLMATSTFNAIRRRSKETVKIQYYFISIGY